MLGKVAFPASLKNEVDYSLPASVTGTSIKVAPSNVQQVQSSIQTVTPSSNVSLLGNSQNVIFDLPAGMSKGTFLDPRYTLLNFRCNFKVETGSSAAVVTSAVLRSCAAAYFDRMFIQSQSGVVLEDMNLYGVIQDELNALEIACADRDALSLMYGFQPEAAGASSQNNVQGHTIAGWDGATLSAGSTYYSYSIPILSSLLGRGASKMLQIGATNRLQLILQTAAVLPVTLVAGTATTAASVSVTMDNISLSLQYIDIGAEGVKMLEKTGLQYYSGITYRASTGTLPAATSGAVSLLTGIRGSSVRSIFTRACESAALTTAGCINYVYDSKMPQATSIQYNINGAMVPPNPVDLLHAPATAFAFLQEANAAFNTYEFKSGLTPDRYCVYVPGGTLPTDADKRITSSVSSVYNQAQWSFGYNLERVSKAGILDGVNCNAANVYLNMVLAGTNTAALTVIFIAKMDAIYILDTVSGEISVRS